MMPEPIIAMYSGTCSSHATASSVVYTVEWSTVTPGGTKGMEPGARMMSCAVIKRPPPRSIWCAIAVSAPNSGSSVTPSLSSEPSRPPLTLATSCFECCAMPSRSNVAPAGSVIPIDKRCASSCSSRTRPDAARRAFEGTQPRFTHVPPTSPPERTQTVRPMARAWSAAPCPPTPQPMMATS
ncbi:hypothetical protein M885DRAFT_509103, partial [Pelagophyceae sp. CCMP2097]